MKKDYYNILGIAKGATQEDIKKAYREKAHKYHPDKAGGDESKFKEINEAYQILGNPDKRAQYDKFGSAFDGSGFSAESAPGGSGWDFSQGGFDFSNADFDLGDLFEGFFGGAKGPAADWAKKKRKASWNYRGRDIGVTLEITLEDAFKGISREIELRKLVKCERCQGEGTEPKTGKIKCKTCNGAGELKKTQRTFFGVFSHATICPTCQGEGEYPEQACKDCAGEGRIRKIEKLVIPIPAGIESGGILRVYNKGEEGIRGGEQGDLEIKVLIKAHFLFQRKGADLYSEAGISFVKAALGSEMEVKTIDGKIDLKIPAGTQSGTIFKLKGKGMPFSANRRGDALIQLNIRTPKNLSHKAQKLLKELEGEL